MKQAALLFSMISKISVLAVLVIVAWVLSSVQGLFQNADEKASASLDPLLTMKKAHADTPHAGGDDSDGSGDGDSDSY